MKAVRLYGYGGPEMLRYEIDAPQPALDEDGVLIEATSTSVNPIDWKVRSGARQKDFPLKFPAILGRDVSGVVRAVGAKVEAFKTGDRVIALAEATYAQFVAVPAAFVAPLPEGLDPIDAAAIPLVSMTGDQLVKFATRAQPGDTILVSGALGSVGRAAVHSARKLGAQVIAAVRGRQLAEAESLGAFQVVALDDDAALSRIGHVDGVADTVGGEIGSKLFERIRPGGRFGYASMLPEGVSAKYPAVEVRRVFARPDAAALGDFAKAVRIGEFILPISKRLPLSEAAAAHTVLERGGGGKIVLTI